MKQGEFQEVNFSKSGFSWGETGGLVSVFFPVVCGFRPCSKTAFDEYFSSSEECDRLTWLSALNQLALWSLRHVWKVQNTICVWNIREPRITESKPRRKPRLKLGKWLRQIEKVKGGRLLPEIRVVGKWERKTMVTKLDSQQQTGSPLCVKYHPVNQVSVRFVHK